MKKLIWAIIAVVIVGGVGFVGIKEYLNVYRSDTAYAVVPATPKKTVTRDSDGKKVTDSQGRQEYSYDYTFKWVTTDGQTRTVGFEQSSANPTPLAPGSYVKADVSKTRVTKGPFSVNAKDVPAKVLQQLK
ncbi:DUF1093 domain-containing protein [Lacticaseibacillus pantheris]|jgi:uncharacterized protein YxeA|nr:DUF1093 domain-containing protein [Lacticaseibacillus pantheris]